MSTSITAPAAPFSPPPTLKAAAPERAAAATTVTPPPSAAATASRGQQQAALTQLLAKYTYDQSQSVDARTLASIGKQISVAAAALGQHVALPHGAGRPAASAKAAAPTPGKVNVTA